MSLIAAVRRTSSASELRHGRAAPDDGTIRPFVRAAAAAEYTITIGSC
jgi:hypothetical protein